MSKKSEEKKIVAPEYDALVRGIEDAREAVKASGKKAIAALFKAFFAEYPEATAVGWTQYTPYFNDGEPCEFSTGEMYVSKSTVTKWEDLSHIDDCETEDGSKEKIWISTWNYDGAKSSLQEGLSALGRSCEDDIFEAAFGDHVMIVATREGFHVSEYSHD